MLSDVKFLALHKADEMKSPAKATIKEMKSLEFVLVLHPRASLVQCHRTGLNATRRAWSFLVWEQHNCCRWVKGVLQPFPHSPGENERDAQVSEGAKCLSTHLSSCLT